MNLLKMRCVCIEFKMKNSSFFVVVNGTEYVYKKTKEDVKRKVKCMNRKILEKPILRVPINAHYYYFYTPIGKFKACELICLQHPIG